jgi:phenylacetate-CoA ligase
MKYLRLLWKLYKLKTNTKKTREEIRELQNKQLRKILLYSYDNSRYYRKAYEKAGITRDKINNLPISSFPTIDKKTLMKNFDELITVNDISQEELRLYDENEAIDKKILKNKYHIVHSSGSTGKPRYFVYDNKAWETMLIAIIRAALWDMSMIEIIKFLMRKPRILYTAATDGRYGGVMAVGDGIEGVGANQLFLDIKTSLQEWIESIKKFKPNMVIGYPSAVKILAELVEKDEIQVDIFRVITCGEPLDGNLRKYLETTLKAEVINFYGASESLALGVEIDANDGMYLFDDMNYIETEDGNMYITCLYNYTQPLIRYKITDRLELKDEKEEWKYPFTKAKNLLGRNEDLMWFENGTNEKDFIHPLAIEGFCIEGLLDYQFKKTANDSFEMIAQSSHEEAKSNIEKEMQEQMRKILAEKNLEYVKFCVRFVKEILPDKKTGKKKLLIN